MTAQTFMADHIERMGLAMAHFVGSTEPDRLGWRQNVGEGKTTRSVIEVVAECYSTNLYFASLLNGESSPRPAEPDFKDAEMASKAIVESSQILAKAVREAPDEALESEFMHATRGPIVGKILMMGAYRNMAYHSGQINFIQTLGGDTEFHMPPTWLSW